MNLNKRQVKALLEVISADLTRPALTYAYIDDYDGKTVLVATDSYKLAVLDVGRVPDPEAHVGKFVARAELLKWYKLAESRDLLTSEGVLGMAERIDEAIKYPDWRMLLTRHYERVATLVKHKEFVGASQLSFNTEYAVHLETLAGGNLNYKLTGNIDMMVATKNGNLYILMPRKG